MSTSSRIRRTLVLAASLAWTLNLPRAQAQLNVPLQPLGCPLAPPMGLSPMVGPQLSPLAPSPGLGLPSVTPRLGAALPAPAAPVVAAPAAAAQPAAVSRAGELLRSVPSFLSVQRSRTELPGTPEVKGQAVKGQQAQGRSAVQAVRPSRPGYEPHRYEPYAILPDGSALAPDSYAGGFYGTHAAPDEVARDHGFTAKGALEDWRLLEHSEERSQPSSAFRGTTPMVSAPGGDQGAAYWADEGGWVYEVRGVPTWDVNSDLEGRVQRPDGSYRGNLMHGEHELAVPAQIPIECIPRWGQVRASPSGMLYVPLGGWVANPAYNAAVCARFFQLGSSN